MTVKQLITHLKKMPQGLEVRVRQFDNSEHETCDGPRKVELWTKAEYLGCKTDTQEKLEYPHRETMLDAAPDKCVLLQL